jgi:Cu+-exporting ATPase
VDLLISISTTVAYMYSVIVGLILAIDPSLVNGDTYFETSALIMTFILLGRYLEILAKSKTYTVLDSLNKHHKGESLLVEGDIGESDARTIPNTLIQRNDVLKVLPGDRIPTDGKARVLNFRWLTYHAQVSSWKVRQKSTSPC